MKSLIIIPLSVFTLSFSAQTLADLEGGWLGVIALRSSELNSLAHAVNPGQSKGTRLNAGFTNFYAQRSCNALQCGVRMSDLEKSLGLGGFVFGNDVMKQYTFRALYAKLLSEQTQMGLSIDFERTCFPEVIVSQWKWDWSISYQVKRLDGVFWIRGNAKQKEWWQSRGHYGTAWTFYLSETTKLNASAVLKLYQKSTMQFGVLHAFNHQWKGFLSYQMQPMQWVLGLIRVSPHFRFAISMMFSSMPMPSIDHQWLYVRS